MTFVNLPVKDIAKATEFFAALGFSFDPRATDDNSTCMILSDGAYVMLHVEPFFKEFTRSEITDTSQSREVTMGVSAASRAQVDDLVDRAVAAAGQAMGGPEDQGGMYMRAFRDLDGHQWSLLHFSAAGPPDGTDGQARAVRAAGTLRSRRCTRSTPTASTSRVGRVHPGIGRGAPQCRRRSPRASPPSLPTVVSGSGGVPLRTRRQEMTVDRDAHIRIRALSRGDVEALRAVFAGMSARSRYLRFHTPMPRLTAPTQRLLTDIDGIRHVAVVAEVAAAGAWRPVGIARLIATGDGVAEVAFEVVDDLQRHGVGRRLLIALRDRARALGHRQVTALVLPENRGAAALLRAVFPEVTVRRNGMVLEFTAPVAACGPADAPVGIADRMAIAV